MIKSKTEFDEPITEEAVAETLKAVRALQDESFRNNPGSRAGFLAAQFALELQHLKSEIISNRERSRG